MDHLDNNELVFGRIMEIKGVKLAVEYKDSEEPVVKSIRDYEWPLKSRKSRIQTS